MAFPHLSSLQVGVVPASMHIQLPAVCSPTFARASQQGAQCCSSTGRRSAARLQQRVARTWTSRGGSPTLSMQAKYKDRGLRVVGVCMEDDSPQTRWGAGVLLQAAGGSTCLPAALETRHATARSRFAVCLQSACDLPGAAISIAPPSLLTLTHSPTHPPTYLPVRQGICAAAGRKNGLHSGSG